MRVAVVCELFCNSKDNPKLLQLLSGWMSPSAPAANQMLSLRALSNCASHPAGQSFLIDHRDQLVAAAVSLKPGSNKNLQIALSSFLLNYAVAYRLLSDIEAKSQCLSAAVTLAEAISDPEACFRLLVCFGTLMYEDQNCVELAKSFDVQAFVSKCKSMKEPAKVSECAEYVRLLMNH